MGKRFIFIVLTWQMMEVRPERLINCPKSRNQQVQEKTDLISNLHTFNLVLHNLSVISQSRSSDKYLLVRKARMDEPRAERSLMKASPPQSRMNGDPAY